MLCSAKGILLLYLGQFCSPSPEVSPGTWLPKFPRFTPSVTSVGLHPKLWYSCRGVEEVICMDLKSEDLSNTDNTVIA